MVTVSIFTLRDVMRKVQAMFEILSHGTRHSDPHTDEEINRLMDYLQLDKIQEFRRNREGNNEVEAVSDLMTEGAAYTETAKAFCNFKTDTRIAHNQGITTDARDENGVAGNGGEGGSDSEGECEQVAEGESEDDCDERDVGTVNADSG